MLESKIISSLEKCYPDQKVSDFAELTNISALKNKERFSFIFKAPLTFSRESAKISEKF